MDRGAIYQKTEKGLNEVATRAHRLPARERSVLILVDGKSTGEQLLAKVGHLGDAEQFIGHLLAEGFIEAARSPLPAPGAPAPQAERPAASPANFAAAKVFAARLLTDLMGPDAEMLALKLERAPDEQQLMVLLEKCRDIVRQMKGRERAERFWSQAQAKLAGET